MVMGYGELTLFGQPRAMQWTISDVTEPRGPIADPALALRVSEAEDLAAAARRRVSEQRARIVALERAGRASNTAGALLRAFEESLRAHLQALADLRAEMARS
jgi:hypothetical protein